MELKDRFEILRRREILLLPSVININTVRQHQEIVMIKKKPKI